MANQLQAKTAYCYQCGCSYEEYRDSIQDGWTNDHSCIESLRERIEQLEARLEVQLDFSESENA